jgi:hypothetical protein
MPTPPAPDIMDAKVLISVQEFHRLRELEACADAVQAWCMRRINNELHAVKAHRTLPQPLERLQVLLRHGRKGLV